MANPYIQYNAFGGSGAQPYLKIEPGVESNHFQYDSPVALNTSTVGLALDANNQFVTKTLPSSFSAFVSSASIPANNGAVVVYDGTSGTLVQQTPVFIDQSGNVTGVTTINGGVISGNNTGNVTLAAIDSVGAPNANAATLSGATGQVLNLNSASASFGGVVNTGTQTFAGNKNFTGLTTIADGTVAQGGLSFSAHTGDGVYYNAGAASLGLASGATSRLVLYHLKTGLATGNQNLVSVSAIPIGGFAHIRLDFLMRITTTLGDLQLGTGYVTYGACNKAGTVTVNSISSGFTTGTAGVASIGWTFAPGPSLFTIIATIGTDQVPTSIQISYNTQMVGDPGVVITYL